MPQPRRAPTGRPVSRPGRNRQRQRTGRPAAPPAASKTAPRRSRFTGRAVVLVLVLSVLTISYASSLKAYFQQHSQIQALQHQIASSESSIARLQSEKSQWKDPAYVQEQARARFGYLMPGETSYVVIGDNGKPLGARASLSDPRTVSSKTPTAWWTTEWRSVQLAGNPPAPAKHPPASFIGGGSR
jgi:cell division protein FtsB